MNRILVLFAHPRFEKSRTNRALLKRIEHQEGITLQDLYEQYPDFNIDVDREKALLVAHQIIIWHHPFYMYSAPALLKQWIDLVLEYGWAHGKGGDFLKGKMLFNAITSGGTREVYAHGRYNRFTVQEFLIPFHQTATQARILVTALGSPDLTSDLIGKVRKLFPHLTIMARAQSRLDAYNLIDLGVKNIYRESLDTSVRLGVDVLVKLGYRKYTAMRAGQNFIKYDEAAMDKLAKHRHDQSVYIFNAREQIQLQEQLLMNDLEVNPTLTDHAWDSDLYLDKFGGDESRR
jgi:putative NADPH-quinone reductase